MAAKRSLKLSSLADDMLAASGSGHHQQQEEPFRARLHQLFAQIEREFELLHAENLNCEFRLFGYY